MAESNIRTIALLALTAAHAPISMATSQAPSHATLLNPGNEIQDEILVLRNADTIHALGSDRISQCYYSRSPDGGRTWTTRSAPFPAYRVSFAGEGDLVAIGTTSPIGSILASYDSAGEPCE